MKKSFKAGLFLTVAVSLALFLAFHPGAVEAKKMKWRLGSAWTQKERNISLELFANLIEINTKGEIKVKFSPSGLLGSHDEIFHGVQEGSIQMGVFAPYVNLVPGGMLNWMNWTVGSYDEAAVAYRPPDGILYKVMDKAYEEVGLKLIWSPPAGPYGLGNKVREMKLPGDLKGLKMRVSASLGFVKTLGNMGEGTGMTLQTIPWADLYNALERNVVDGNWDLWASLIEERHYEVLKYYTALGFGWDSCNVAINRELWDGLSDKHKEAIWEAGRMAEERDFEAHRRADKAYQKQLIAGGLKIYFPTPQEKKVWRDKAQMDTIWKELCDPWLEKHYPGKNMGKIIRDELDRVRTEVGQ
jgi:TRAP-type C4-dicarboxylate transport system substrate-binding protein